jgi:excisionase family DNA binding protein
MNDTLEYLTVEQIAARWGVHRETVLRRLRWRQLPSLLIGRRRRVSMLALQAYEASLTVNTIA